MNDICLHFCNGVGDHINQRLLPVSRDGLCPKISNQTRFKLGVNLYRRLYNRILHRVVDRLQDTYFS